MSNLAGDGDRFKGRERVADNCSLVIAIKGSTHAMPQGIINEQSTWWSPGLQNVERAANRDRCNAMCFKISCYQTPGLMADGSHGYQEHRVYGLGLEFGA
jgi:hypothetical protein